ncbi:hypothetical protein [Saccharopolyspora erythraea]|uniref:Transposase n=1 Tax=Saccharopolyspora erythraea TaxID=1836 RepID=A0ABN1EG06_SACER|nr:hypothetical protein [Saccharopolyspora erythraea]QRK88006.1 hypothetical protein JQX30_25125 [Saccharopolyspora erythraea]
MSSGELAYYIVHTTHPQPLIELVRVGGSRRRAEETFQFAKNEIGLDHYQVRRYEASYRHTNLTMLAAHSEVPQAPRKLWSAPGSGESGCWISCHNGHVLELYRSAPAEAAVPSLAGRVRHTRRARRDCQSQTQQLPESR